MAEEIAQPRLVPYAGREVAEKAKRALFAIGSGFFRGFGVTEHPAQ